MSVCVWLCVCVCVWEVRVCVCEWRGEFNRVVLVVQLGLIFHFILYPELRRVFQLVNNNNVSCSLLSDYLWNKQDKVQLILFLLCFYILRNVNVFCILIL
jgi:hypothetical protein